MKCRKCNFEITKQDSITNDGMCFACAMSKDGKQELKKKRTSKDIKLTKKECIKLACVVLVGGVFASTISTNVSTSNEDTYPMEIEEPLVNETNIEHVIQRILVESFGELGSITISRKGNTVTYNVPSSENFVKSSKLALTMGINLQQYNQVIDSFKDLSMSIHTLAVDQGSNNIHSLAIKNDMNTDNVVLIFSNGEVIYNAFN